MRYPMLLCALVLAITGCGGDEADGRAKPSSKERPEVSRDAERARVARAVDRAVEPIMRRHDVPGMAVGVTVGGRRYLRTYGVASKAGGRRVSGRTIFEIGSLSKTFTATLGSWARERGALSLSDGASRHWPALAGTRFDQISLLDLATYTAGGLPLQFPDEVTDERRMLRYFRYWLPDHAPGARRLYSNPSIGLFGRLAARSLGRPFDELMERRLFPRLGLRSTFIDVPRHRMRDYAFGYSKDGEPIRVSPGVLDSEAYGVKSTAPDMIRFIEQNMGAGTGDADLRRAILATHTGYQRVRGMTQGLGWEIYGDPADLDALLEGNSPEVALEPNPVEALRPPQSPRRAGLVNKTGSTNGFGAYAAFVPSRRTGVVILANRNYPIPERVRAGHAILGAVHRGHHGPREAR